MATITLHAQHSSGTVDPRVFGGFLEHIGRAVYQGVYEPGNPLSDAEGFRADVLEALRPLRFPIMRYPGGNFVSAYDWRDGIGPRDKRPRRTDFAWRSVESNQFGTDEFMRWCKLLGTQPMLAVNLGTAGAAEAVQLLEYCNHPGGTQWSDLRKNNGHAEPYGVKLWCLGNEMDGPWQAGHVPADVYAHKARAASAMMKGIDPTIQTIACGSSHVTGPTYLQWDRTVLEYCWEKIDYISAHRYSDNWKNDSAAFLAEGTVIDRMLQDYDGVIHYVRGMRRSDKRVYVAFDEWNVWYRERAEDGKWQEAPHMFEEVYNLEDALVVAQHLAAFVRRADLVKIACIAQIVNVIAPILTRASGLLVQSIYWPLMWFGQHAPGKKSLTPMIESPTYTAGYRGEVPALDAAAVLDEAAGSLCVFMVNRSPSALPVSIGVAEKSLTHVTGIDALGGSDLKAGNSWEHPHRVKPGKIAATAGDGMIRLDLPPTSFACVRCAVSDRK